MSQRYSEPSTGGHLLAIAERVRFMKGVIQLTLYMFFFILSFPISASPVVGKTLSWVHFLLVETSAVKFTCSEMAKMIRDAIGEHFDGSVFVPQNVGILLTLVFLTYVLVISILSFQFVKKKILEAYPIKMDDHVVEKNSFLPCFLHSSFAT